LKNTLNGFFSKWVPKKSSHALKFLAFDSAGSYEQDQMFRPFRKK